MLNIYIENKSAIFKSYIESGLVNVLETKPECYALIERKSCSCNTRNGIAVYNSSILINNFDNYIKGYENYIFDYKYNEEITTVIFWLLKSNFYTFDFVLEKSKYTRHLSERFFSIYHKSCGCIEYKLIGEPIYCLKNTVVSCRRTGPTIKSVI